MDIIKTLKELSNSYSLGELGPAAQTAAQKLSEYCETEIKGGCIFARLKGSSDYTVLIDAHIDEVGFIVTDIADSGFVTAAAYGSIDLRHLSAKSVVIHGKKDIPAVFISTPPHLKKADEAPEDISDIKLDTGLGSFAKDVISVGDYISYATESFMLSENIICGKSLDNRAGVACVLELCERLHEKKLPVNVAFMLSNQEEIGLRGAKTGSFAMDIDEAVIIDVSFANAPDVSPLHSGVLGGGAMLGISPILNRKMGKKLKSIAEENGILNQPEVMAGNTATNADAVSLTKSGIPTCLLSVPLRNMHTDTEVADINDLISVCDILEKYILSGGVKNA